MFSVIPKRPITSSNYICDKKFHIENLRVLEQDNAAEQFYGVAIVNGRFTELWKVSNIQTILLKSFETTTMNHHSRGGSSAGRLQRLRENKTQRNVSYISEQLDSYYLDEKGCNVSALIIAGCAEMRQNVVEELHPLLQSALVGSYACEGRGVATVKTLFQSLYQTDISSHCLLKERLQLDELWEVMEKNSELLDYGFNDASKENYKIVYYDATMKESRKIVNASRVVALYFCKDLLPFGSCVCVKFTE